MICWLHARDLSMTGKDRSAAAAVRFASNQLFRRFPCPTKERKHPCTPFRSESATQTRNSPPDKYISTVLRRDSLFEGQFVSPKSVGPNGRGQNPIWWAQPTTIVWFSLPLPRFSETSVWPTSLRHRKRAPWTTVPFTSAQLPQTTQNIHSGAFLAQLPFHHRLPLLSSPCPNTWASKPHFLLKCCGRSSTKPATSKATQDPSNKSIGLLNSISWVISLHPAHQTQKKNQKNLLRLSFSAGPFPAVASHTLSQSSKCKTHLSFQTMVGHLFGHVAVWIQSLVSSSQSSLPVRYGHESTYVNIEQNHVLA